MSVMSSETAKQAQDQEWAQLIALTAQGDQAALATFYDRTSPQVFGLVYKILNNRESPKKSLWTSTPKCGVRPMPTIEPEARRAPG